MTKTNKPLLIVVSGPVGGGKSTVSHVLAELLREDGHKVAVIDLDLVYNMSCQNREKWEPDNLFTARRGVAALADVFFGDGIEIVIVDGEFFNKEELDNLYNNVTTEVDYKFVTLNVSYEEVSARVAADFSRTASRNPQILRRLYAMFEEAQPFIKVSSLFVDADRRTPRSIAEVIITDIRKG
jgi:tRNA uridine 5-carbamoylmethylation protein Kti12